MRRFEPELDTHKFLGGQLQLHLLVGPDWDRVGLIRTRFVALLLRKMTEANFQVRWLRKSRGFYGSNVLFQLSPLLPERRSESLSFYSRPDSSHDMIVVI